MSSIKASGGGVFVDQNPFPSVGREEIALLERGLADSPCGRDAAVHAQTHLVKKIAPTLDQMQRFSDVLLRPADVIPVARRGFAAMFQRRCRRFCSVFKKNC
jgi:hypothetical protein